MGDKAYPQAPFMEVFNENQILDKYGKASMFASGLIVEALKAFNGDLWQACATACGWGLDLDPESSDDLLKRDWVRRAKKFAKNYFDNDILEMANCLKDCHNLHKWTGIERYMEDIDFASQLQEKVYVDADTLGAQSCNGGACEISF